MSKQTAARYGINTLVLAVVFLALNAFVQSGTSVYYAKQLMPIGIYIIMAVSLNLTCGFLGQLPLGHAGFMAVGAYTSAIFTLHVDWGMPNLEMGVALLLGGLMAAAFGIVVGLPALRLRGDYLAIITLGFGEIIRNIILNLEITGGAKNLRGIEKFTNFPWTFACVVITVFAIQTLIRSRHGRAIISIRENEIAAAACGVNTTFYKTLAFTIAAFFAGIGGGLYAHYVGVLSATSFGFNKSIEILVMVVLGGMGSIAGSVISATALTILPELLRAFADWRMVIYSLLLVVAMIFRPKGLMGTYDFSLVGSAKDIVRFFKELPQRRKAKRDAGKGGAAR